MAACLVSAWQASVPCACICMCVCVCACMCICVYAYKLAWCAHWWPHPRQKASCLVKSWQAMRVYVCVCVHVSSLRVCIHNLIFVPGDSACILWSYLVKGVSMTVPSPLHRCIQSAIYTYHMHNMVLHIHSTCIQQAYQCVPCEGSVLMTHLSHLYRCLYNCNLYIGHAYEMTHVHSACIWNDTCT